MLAVGAGLQERGAGLVLPRVHLVSVAVEDDVNIGGRVSVDRCEVAALAGGIPGTVGSAFVVFGNDDVGQALALETLGLGIHSLNRITNGEVGNAGGGDQGGQVVGDSADDTDAHSILDDDRRRFEVSRYFRGALFVDVGAEVGAVEMRHDALG